MSTQSNLFSPKNLAGTVQIPAAPNVASHAVWPYPGLTPLESAQAALAISTSYVGMLAAVLHAHGQFAAITSRQLLALIPAEWRAAVGKFAHASISIDQGKRLDINVRYIQHDDGGFHFSYQIIQTT